MYDNIYSPWRSPYFSNIDSNSCVFCEISKQISSKNSDEDSKKLHVFYKDSICYGVMNLYPYTPGHFMLIPHSHVDSPHLLSMDSWIHINKLAKGAIAMLHEYGASGINMGINIRAAAGAGIPNHLHLHFVPRFEGDTNFITTIGNARVYGVEFDKIFDRILNLAKKHLIA